MSNQIEQIRSEIKRLKYEEYNGGTMCEDVALGALEYVESFINSLPSDSVDVDFEAEYKQYMASRRDDVSGHAVTINLKDLALHFAEWERARIESELRLAWGKISMNPFDTDSVFRELLEHLKR